MIDRHRLSNLMSPQEWLLRLVFWGGAISVGITAVLFTQGAKLGNDYFHRVLSISPWLAFVVMPAGLFITAWLSQRFFAGVQGSGIPQTIAALHPAAPEQLSGLLSLRIAVGKMALTILALCCGASVGREGPTVQIGASIMYSLRRFSRLTRRDQVAELIVAGGAAGVAAAFNTPLAGIAFAIEELSRSYVQRTNGLVLTAIIFAGIAANALLGNYTYFGTISSSLGSIAGWFVVIVCGVMGGVCGGIFTRLLIGSSDGWPGPLTRWMKLHPLSSAALCGLVLACLGMISGHHTYGTGYDEVRDILAHGDEGYQGFGLFKFLATFVSYLSGIPGGVFAPSLAIGAGFGATISHLFTFVPSSTVIVLGMAAYFSGVTQAPLTTFIIVMEMTDNHSIVLPLMATSLIGHGISRIVCHAPLYRALAEQFLRRID